MPQQVGDPLPAIHPIKKAWAVLIHNVGHNNHTTWPVQAIIWNQCLVWLSVRA